MRLPPLLLLLLLLLPLCLHTGGFECAAGGPDDDDELAVRRLYEAAPYPPRLHGRHLAGHRVLVECLPGVVDAALPGLSLLSADDRFSSRFSRQRPFRMLIAGGGTGDPTLACAHSFDLAGIPVHVVHLDLSERSTDVARRRVRQLLDGSLAKRITFVRGSIAAAAAAASRSSSSSSSSSDKHNSNYHVLDVNNPQHTREVEALFGRPFDYIHSTGVLHHSRSVEHCLKVLSTLLHEDGGMALWVYASSGGRDGVHDFQRMMKMLMPRTNEEIMDMRHVWGRSGAGGSDGTIRAARERLGAKHAARLEMAWELLTNLPPTNRLVRNPVLWNSVSGWLAQHEEALQGEDQDDEGEPRWDVRISDMFLNPVDREFSVRDVLTWLAKAELEPATWLDTESGNFDVDIAPGNGRVGEAVSHLDEVDRLALGELMQGTAVGHRLIARKKKRKSSDADVRLATVVPPILID
jgi:hypothetical protein